MIGGKPDKDSDEKRFNETVQRMLKTPPKPHDKVIKSGPTHGREADNVAKPVPKQQG
ncbi:hypothetical protein [Mesorhizobium sp. M0488]|uniref:hypothetical protein n=1 Tax=unclassified Mesorhizobium TaxID=325217 RepID=UPI00333A94C3